MKYELVFEDQFDIDGRPNDKFWDIEVAGHGGGNNEAQYYTDSEKNVFVKDGMLHIVALKESFKNKEYTSAKLLTYGKHSIQYGKVEVRAKLPKGLGSWPAIWMMPDSFKEGKSWPLCGEIDIMEHIGRRQDEVHFSLHTKTYNFQNEESQFTEVMNLPDMSNQFYTYGMEWDEEKISFSVDGETLAICNKTDRDDISEKGWPFDQPFYLILNLAVGGHWGGAVDDSTLPWVMNVESVKVYKKL